MIKMEAVAVQASFDFSKSSLVSVSKMHYMKQVSKSVTSFCHLIEAAGFNWVIYIRTETRITGVRPWGPLPWG